MTRRDDRRRDAVRHAASLLGRFQLGPLLALLLACAFFASQTDRFLTGAEPLARRAAGDGRRRASPSARR